MSDYKKKPVIVAFEGPDKVGKSTLLAAFNKATDFHYLVIDRLTTSSFVYTDAFDRGDDAFSYFESVQKAFNDSFTVIQVLLMASIEDINDRLDVVGERLPAQLSDIGFIKAQFMKFAARSGYKTIVINTSKTSIEEAVDIIIEEVKWTESQDGKDCI